MANTPKYVRLSERAQRGVMVDLQSGWSISGLDVKEAPQKSENRDAYTFVRQKLAQGVLEPASKAEYDEVKEIQEEGREEFFERIRTAAELGLAVPEARQVLSFQEGQSRARADARRQRIVNKKVEAREEEELEDLEYSEWTNNQLRDELDRRELSTSGNKDELVARLEEDDVEERETVETSERLDLEDEDEEES